MRLGIIAIGITEDGYKPHRWGIGVVRFADRDAEAVLKSLQDAWPQHEISAHLLLNGQATFAAINSAVDTIAEIGRLDFLIVFLGGHGHSRTNNGQTTTVFCLADGTAERPSLTGIEVGKLLSRIEAKTTLMLVDCCYAESFAASCGFFHELPQTVTARLWLAAASTTEESWEDEESKHGVFTLELLRALTRGDSSNAHESEHADVVRDVFPHLAANVPIRAAQTAPAREQHPVVGGSARGPVLLPRIRTQEIHKEITPLIAFRKLVKVSAVVATCIAILLGVFMQTSQFHLAQGPNGNIVVRRGTATTDFLSPGRFGIFADTEFGPTSLAAQDSALAPLRSGALHGWWFPLTSNGYRNWVKTVQPFLGLEAAGRAELYLNGNLSEDWLQLLSDRPEPWLLEVASEAALFGQTSNLPTWRILAAFPTVLRVDQDAMNAQVLDFTVLFLKTAAIEKYARTIGNIAVLDDNGAFSGLVQLKDMIAHRIDNPSSDIDVQEEAKLLMQASRTLVEQRTQGGKPAFTSQEIAKLRNSKTVTHRKLGIECLAVAGKWMEEHLQTEVQSALVAELATFNVAKQGSSFTAGQLSAAQALASQIQHGSQPHPTTFETILRIGEDFGGLLLMPAEIVEIFIQAAKQRALPANITEKFIQDLRLPVESNGPAIFPLMKVLAYDFESLSETQRGVVIQEIEGITKVLSANDKILPQCAEVLGILGEQGICDGFMLRSISHQIRFRPYIDRPDPGEDPRITIKADDGEAFVVALGRVAQRKLLNSALESLLWRAAVNRSDAADYPSIVRGLAAQEKRPLKSAADIRDFISLYAKSFPERRLATEIVSYRLRDRGSATMDSTMLASLRSACDIEEEPELRTALRKILLDCIRNPSIR